MINIDKRILKRFDKPLFISTVAVFLIGLFMIYSASSSYFSSNVIVRQLVWMSLGLLLLICVVFIDYQRFIDVAYLLYGINIFLLIIVLFLGETRGGAHRWLNLGFFNFQPSELAKITLVLALSSFIGKRKRETAKLNLFLGSLALVLPVFILVLIEPDLGTAMLFIPIALSMLFIAGINVRYILGTLFLGFISLPFFWQILRDYQKQRLLVFINPNVDPLGSGYTIIQSKIAIGSGGIFGKGWLSGTQSQLNFLPERHTDFIFSVVGEEWGFVGALLLIMLYALIVYRGIKIIETTPDIFGRLIATGFITIFSLQVFINIGMTIGFFPIVGLTLPLISYGGSSLITTLIYIGLLLNISMRRPLF